MVNTTFNGVTIAIFSFNRGKYLKNLLESIDRHVPFAKVVVFDDKSDDEETKRVLSNCSVDVRINSSVSEARHGNLYANMQSALEVCESRYLLLLQDDTQIVRDVTESDLKIIEGIFSDPTVAFLRPQFLKLAHADRFISSTVPDYSAGTLTPIMAFGETELGNAFCDVVLCDAQKLKRIGWIFKDSERANQLQAQNLFSSMPFLLNPFIFYCPEVPSYRNRKLYFASRLVQRNRNDQIVCFESLEYAKLSEFLNRPKGLWPIAENFLETNFTDVRKPFVFQDYARSPWLNILYKVERRIWRIGLPVVMFFRRHYFKLR